MEALASVPGISLFPDGVHYSFRNGCLGGIFSLYPSQEGFAPIEHINAIEVAEIRSLPFLVLGVALVPLIIGILMILWWLFNPQTALIIRSDGSSFVTLVIGKQYRNAALEFVNKYRRLKTHFRSNSKMQAS